MGTQFFRPSVARRNSGDEKKKKKKAQKEPGSSKEASCRFATRRDVSGSLGAAQARYLATPKADRGVKVATCGILISGISHHIFAFVYIAQAETKLLPKKISGWRPTGPSGSPDWTDIQLFHCPVRRILEVLQPFHPT